MEKEYFKIDVESGNILDVVLLSDGEEVPEDHKPGWGSSRPMYNPKWDFELNDWVESDSMDAILSPVKESKILKLSDECQTVIMFGFILNGDLFQFNDKDQANFNQQLSLMIIDPSIATVLWKTENNGIKQFTREQFIEICKAGERHKRENIGRYWQLKQYVLTHEFTSVDELNAINFGTELPV